MIRPMPLPTFDRVIAPLYDLLGRNPEGIRRAHALKALAQHFQLTDDERAKRLESGRQPAFLNCVDWAIAYLKGAGLATSPQRGIWQLTSDGLTRYQASGPLAADEAAAIVRQVRRARRRDIAATDEPVAAHQNGDGATLRTAEERIEDAVREIRSRTEVELLERVAQLHPTDFEHLVLELLAAMGYAERGETRHTGGSGDGGIDGVVLMDRLGLDRIYMQAKRVKLGSVVPPDDVRAFFGALEERRAHRGVFCTSGRFSDESRRKTVETRSTIRLIDGRELVALLIEFGLGVQVETIRLPRFDADFFDRFTAD